VRGVTDGKSVPAYTEEEGGKPSDTETFVALCAHVDNWRWAGVPFYLRTGKRLPTRTSQIVIQFRDVPHSIFNGSAADGQPADHHAATVEESIALTIMNKTPTLTQGGYELQPLSLNLSLLDAFKGEKRRSHRLRAPAARGHLRQRRCSSAATKRMPPGSGSTASSKAGRARGMKPTSYPVWQLGPGRRLRAH
jgi:glucose-6-phosphate 1-dehydrogenase